MKIWLVVPYEPLPTIDNTGRYLRYGMLSNELSKNEHNDVTLWMSDFDHVKKLHRYGYTNTQKIRDNFIVRLIFAPGYKKNVSIGRIKHNLIIANNFKREINSEKESPDIIVSCLPTLELAEQAVLFAKKNNVPIIIDVVDIWPDVYLTAFPKPLQRIFRFFLTSEYRRAKRILLNAEAITAVSNTYLSWALKCSGRLKKEEDDVFPLGYSSSILNNADVDEWENKFRKDFNIVSGTILVTFIGQFEKSYDLETIIFASQRFSKNKSIKFILAGNGVKNEKLKEMSRNTDNVYFTGWLNHAAMSALLRVTSVGLAAYSNVALQSLPYKPFEYMASSIPILSSLKGEFEEIIETEKIGRTYKASNVDSFCEELNWFLSNSNHLKDMGRRAKLLFDLKYSATLVYPNMVNYMEKIISNKKGKG